MAEDYKPGSMDITTQEKTFEGFIRFTVRSSIAIVIFLLLLAIFNG